MAEFATLFPSSSPARVPERPLPSSLSSTSNLMQPPEGYLESLQSDNARLATLPKELCSEPSIADEADVKLIQDTLLATLRDANYNTSSAKWTDVAHVLRMLCTSRRYVGVGDGVQMGGEEAPVGDFKFILPDTREEWADCERRWECRTLQEHHLPAKTSKYFAKGSVPRKAERKEAAPSKAEQVRDKVKRWQASITGDPSERQSEASGSSSTARPSKGKERQVPQQQSLMADNALPMSSARQVENTPGSTNGKMETLPVVRGSPAIRVPAHIGEIPEEPYLPPSFPAHMITSTPPPQRTNQSDHRQKPPPIFHASTSPSASPHLPKSQLERIKVPLASSSSLPNITLSPKPRGTKRLLTPPADDAKSKTSPQPALKRARLEANSSVGSRSDAPVVQSTALLPVTPPPKTPAPRLSTGKGLGNAKGSPVPVSSPITPLRPQVPTLTALLASSRRSKPRPRPPSRKSKSRGTTPAPVNGRINDIVPAAGVRTPREGSPALTAPRTMLSSPASGSSSSSAASTPHRSHSPASPLFTQKVGAFAPPLASTQALGAVDGQNVGGAPSRKSSGVIGMAYNSQFDVEGQVGMVSDLLDKDVHFEDWIRDIPEVEADS